MSRARLGLALLAAGLALAPPGPAAAQPIAGDCSGTDFRRELGYQEGWISGDGPLVLTLSDGAVAYSDSDAGNRATTFPFNSRLVVKQNGTELVGVTPLGRDQKFWMRRADLLCSRSPLTSRENGLERKALLRIQTAARSDQVQTIQTYRSPNSSECTNDCRKLSRFELYFVVAEAADSVLLSQDLTLDRPDTRSLVGWVKKADVVEWPWAVGLRPDKDLKYADGPGTICAYRSVADAEAKRDCQPIIGGLDWFKSEIRLLVMGVEGHYYKIFDPSVGAVPLFVRQDDKIELDVWMRLEQVKNWRDLLKRVIDTDASGEERRKALVDSLVLAVQSIIREPAYEDTNESFRTYIRRLGKLPAAFRSPLLNYSFSELLDPRAVPLCEIVHIVAWARASLEMLSIAEGGRDLADVELSFGPHHCPGMSEHGRKLPVLASAVRVRSMPSSAHSICRAAFGTQVCWVPHQYLP